MRNKISEVTFCPRGRNEIYILKKLLLGKVWFSFFLSFPLEEDVTLHVKFCESPLSEKINDNTKYRTLYAVRSVTIVAVTILFIA